MVVDRPVFSRWKMIYSLSESVARELMSASRWQYSGDCELVVGGNDALKVAAESSLAMDVTETLVTAILDASMVSLVVAMIAIRRRTVL